MARSGRICCWSQVGRRLRIGYLSADYCNHPVGRFMLPILENHDKSKVEVWGISCGPHQDWISEHLQNKCEHWMDCRFQSDIQAARVDRRSATGCIGRARRIYEWLTTRDPDPSTNSNSIKLLGFPAPTYLNCVDGWLGDEVLFGELSTTDCNAHALLKIKGGYMVFNPGGTLPTPVRGGRTFSLRLLQSRTQTH